MKNIVFYLVIAVSVISFTACKRETIEQKMYRETAESSRKNCPQEMDAYTTLDSMSYDMSSRTMNYFYTVHDELDNDTLYSQDVIDDFSDKLLSNIKSSISLKGYKKEGIAFHYLYYSKSKGDVLLEYSFTKEDYD